MLLQACTAAMHASRVQRLSQVEHVPFSAIQRAALWKGRRANVTSDTTEWIVSTCAPERAAQTATESAVATGFAIASTVDASAMRDTLVPLATCRVRFRCVKAKGSTGHNAMSTPVRVCARTPPLAGGPDYDATIVRVIAGELNVTKRAAATATDHATRSQGIVNATAMTHSATMMGRRAPPAMRSSSD